MPSTQSVWIGQDAGWPESGCREDERLSCQLTSAELLGFAQHSSGTGQLGCDPLGLGSWLSSSRR